MPLSPKELKLREASRDLGAELLESVDFYLRQFREYLGHNSP